MRIVVAAGGFEGWLTSLALKHPVAHKAALLNVVQHFFHGLFGCVVRHNARARNIFAIFSSVGDGIVHVGNAAFIDQIHNQLHFVQALEISHFRGITRFHQRFKASADQLNQAAAQHSLLAEQICFALFFERGFNHARATAANARSVSQRDVMSVARSIVLNRDQARHAAAFLIFAAHSVARAFRGDHDDINGFLWLNQVEMHVQTMGKRQGRAIANVWRDFIVIDVSLQLVRGQHHDDVSHFSSLGHSHNFQAFAFRFFGSGRASAQGNHHIGAATIAQVQRMGMAL